MPTTTNFEDFVTLMAEEAPHALVLDWYRRLELTVRAYLASRGLEFVNGPAAERVISQDTQLGPAASTTMAELRTIRNKLTHGWEPLGQADAITFTRRAFALIGDIMRSQDAHAN
jgi:hypothetical protein